MRIRDGEIIAENERARLAVSNATDALTFASEADVIVTGIVLDGPMDGVELSKPCLPDALLREVRLLLSRTHHTVGAHCRNNVEHTNDGRAVCEQVRPKQLEKTPPRW